MNPRLVRLPVVDGHDIGFQRLSSADALSQARVSHITQDDQGFMWFGTQYGLNRYDGYNFRVFVNDPTNPRSLSGVYIGALFKDRHGALWVGCAQSLDRFDPTTETVIRYPIQLVSHISQDAGGRLWLATGKGLQSLDPTNGQIRQYAHDPKDPASLSTNDVKSSGEDRRGRFWVATGAGLEELDRTTGKVMLRVPLPEPLREFSFYEDRFGVFWILHASGNGLAVLDRDTNTLTHYSFRAIQPQSTALAGVMAMLEDRNGNLWLGTQGSGLLKFDREHQRFIAYRRDEADPQSLAHNRILSLFEDREGNIWAGLGGMGPILFPSKARPFRKFPDGLRNPHSKGETFVAALHEDRDGTLWIGAREALTRIDRRTGDYQFFRTAAPGVGSDVISIAEHRGLLWLGTFNHGLHRFDRKTGRFKTYRHSEADPSSLSNDIVARVLADRDGTLWAATWDGLNKFDATTERFTRYRLDSKVKDLFYIEMAEDPQGALWLGTHASGLQRFDPETGAFTVYEHDLGRPGTLSDNRVNSIRFDRSGTMWVGTQNGLNRFEPASASFTTYNSRNGLAGNAIGCVLEDERGDLWLSTNMGVSRFNRRDNSFTNFSTADGLPGPDLTGWGGCFKSPTREMFFGGFSGAVAFHPDRVVESSYRPPVVLTDFRLFGNPVNIGDRSPLTRAISYVSDLTLSYDQDAFSLTFAALSYANPLTNRYRYKLEGLDQQWTEVASDRRVASYTTLPADSYTFRVQGATNSGVWSEPGVVLRIRVVPPWWRTWWFRASVIAMLCGALWIAHYYRVRQIAWRLRMRLDERVAERARIARELHDTLLQSLQGLVLLFQTAANLLPSRPLDAKDSLDRALDRAQTAIEESRDAVQDLRGATVGDLAQALNALGQDLVAQETRDSARPVSTVRVLTEGSRRPLQSQVRDEVGRMAFEALRNAVRHAQARQIEVDVIYGKPLFRVRIRDDGTGIDPTILNGGGRGGHWGLVGMRERATRIGAALEIWSRPGLGTEIDMSIPGSVAYEGLSAVDNGRAKSADD